MLFSGLMLKRVVICMKAIQIIIINNQFLIIITEKKSKKRKYSGQPIKMSNTSKQLQNDPQHPPLNQDINNLPQPIREIWITNKRLQKQIDILKIQIGEKDRIIRQLKIQIDSNILEDTKNRLQFLRMVDQQVIQKTKQAKQQYMQKIVVFEAEFEKRTKMVFTIERQLQIQKQNNKILASKLKDLKQHIIVALDQKDLIIRELTKIISSQEMNVRVEQIKRQAAQKYQIKRPNSNLDDYQYRTKRNYRNPDRDRPEQPPARYRNQQQQKHESQKQKQKQRQKAQVKNISIKQKTSKVKIKRNV